MKWQAFYERSREVMGPDWAATLVKAIPPAGGDALATKPDVAAPEARFGLRMAAELAQLRTEMAEIRGDVRSEVADLRASMEEKLQGQTWRLSGLLVATLGVGITLARLA